MKLKSLKLENFRQHEDSYLEFSDGITIINGANGAGKSTILEAITWALYGTEAARGNKDTIKFNKAKPRTKVKAKLTFELDKDTFRIDRYLDKAEVYLNDNAAPVVTSQQEVTKYLTDKIGMTKSEFFNTYFTGQKELNFLKNQGPTDRRKFISHVLNYDKVIEARDLARSDKNSLEKDISGLKLGLEDMDELKEEKAQIKLNQKEAKAALEAKQKEFSELSGKLAKVEPEWEEIKVLKETHDKLTWESKSLSEKSEFLEKNCEKLTEQVKTLEEKNKKLKESANIELEYRAIEVKIKEQETLQEKDAQRQKFVSNMESLEKRITEKQAQLEEIIKSGKEKKAKVEQLPILNEEISKLNEQIQKIESDLSGQKREKEVLIQQKQAEIAKIKKQLAVIQDKGEDGACPTCQRALKGEFEKVTGNFQAQIDELTAELNTITEKLTKLNQSSDNTESLKKQKLEKERQRDTYSELKGVVNDERERYIRVKGEIDNNQKDLETARLELAKLPQGFDIEQLKKLREQIAPLKAKYEQMLTLKAEVAGFDKAKNEYDEAIKEKQKVTEKLKSLTEDLKGLSYSQEAYKKTEKAYNEAKEIFNESRLEVVKIESEEKNIANELDRIRKIEDSNKEKTELINKKCEELDLLAELDRFYHQLWEKLNNNARPEISELASKFLSDLTDNRYSIMELNDKYDICLHDDGEIKPVISGGEEDIVNLCIRLAVSQIIAQRSGKALSLLILDEIFGSLDESRRGNVIELLRSLTDHFEQVILITHIDDMKMDIDNVINIEFDQERGAAKISNPDINFERVVDTVPELV